MNAANTHSFSLAFPFTFALALNKYYHIGCVEIFLLDSFMNRGFKVEKCEKQTKCHPLKIDSSFRDLSSHSVGRLRFFDFFHSWQLIRFFLNGIYESIQILAMLKSRQKKNPSADDIRRCEIHFHRNAQNVPFSPVQKVHKTFLLSLSPDYGGLMSKSVHVFDSVSFYSGWVC